MLNNLQSNAYSLFTNSRFWMILVLVIFFLCVSGYVYQKYVTPLTDEKYIANNEFIKKSDEQDKSEDIDIYFLQLYGVHTVRKHTQYGMK